jgi:uncharacterized protein DUF2793/trimeric autotransporter adhesin
MSTTPNIDLEQMPANTLQPSVPFNDAMQVLDALVRPGGIIQEITSTPPSTLLADAGKMWLIGTGATGVWTGLDGQLALCTGEDLWRYFEAGEGWQTYNLDDSQTYVSDGSGTWTAGGGGGGGSSSGLQYAADTGSTADSDPGPGLMKWNNATQTSATVLFLDDATTDGASLTGLWAAMDSGGFARLQHASDTDTWQIWEITGITDAAGYVKLAVTLLASNGTFADDDPMVINLEQGATGGSFTGGSLSSALNEAKGSDIASAGTTDIGAATGNMVHVTGTTTITGLGTIQAGTRRIVVFDGILTLTHNATSLILPTGANITTAAGDAATFISEGSGNWRCIDYQRKDGTALASSGGSLTNWTEAVNTSSPNVTIPVASFTPSNGATNVDAVIKPKGAGAFALNIADSTATGGNKRGANSIDLQNTRSAAANVASGSASVAIGSSNTANATQSTAIGAANTASGSNAAVLGVGSTASGNGSVALGNASTAAGVNSFAANNGSGSASGDNSVAVGPNCTSAGDYSWATGRYAQTRGVYGAKARACFLLAAAGDAQYQEFVLCSDTTDGTPEALSTNNASPNTANQAVLPNTSAYIITGEVIARQNTTGDCKSWTFRATIKRGANAAATAIVGSAVVTVADADAGASAWTLAVTADTTRGSASLGVTGEAAKSIKWTAYCRAVEVVG